MTWCFSTRASVAAVLTTHPCVSRCLRVNRFFYHEKSCAKMTSAIYKKSNPEDKGLVFVPIWFKRLNMVSVEKFMCYTGIICANVLMVCFRVPAVTGGTIFITSTMPSPMWWVYSFCCWNQNILWWLPSNLLYKSQPILKLKCFSSRLAVVFVQSIEARC